MADSLMDSRDAEYRARLVSAGYVQQDRDVQIREGFISFWKLGDLTLMLMEFPPAKPYMQRIDGTFVDPFTITDRV